MNCISVLSKNKNITYELVRKSVKQQYRNSFLGVLWTVLNPLLNMLVMWVVFSQFFGRGDPLYPIYLLAGNILFQFLRTATSRSLTSVVDNRGLLTKVKIDTYLFPMSSTISSLINFGFSLISLLVIMFFMQVCGGYDLFGYQMLFVVLMLPAMLLFMYGISLFLSAIYVFCRDIKYIYSVFLTLWQYLTPIFYKFSVLGSGEASAIVKMNPMFYFVEYFRDCMYNCQFSGMAFPSFKILGFLYLFGTTSILIGYVVFRSLKRKFITNL